MGSARRFLGVWPRSRPLPGSVDRSRGRGGVPAVHVRRWCRPASMLPWRGPVHTSSPLREVRIKIAQPTADQDNSPKYLCRRSDVVDDGVLDRFDLKYLNVCGVATRTSAEDKTSFPHNRFRPRQRHWRTLYRLPPAGAWKSHHHSSRRIALVSGHAGAVHELTPGCPSPDEGDGRRHAKPGQRPSRCAGLSSTRHRVRPLRGPTTRSTPPASPVRSAR